MIHNFRDKFNFAMAKASKTDFLTIMEMLPGCVSVSLAKKEIDKKGVDYIAKLDGGAEIYIDSKTRMPGCSKYWKEGPELAIEIWSVLPGGKYNLPYCQAKPGWTFDNSKVTDMIFYNFDICDSKMRYLLSFQTLRIASIQNIRKWMKEYKVDIQDSGSWQSMAVFVPAIEVLERMKEAQKFKVE